jgi:hypothetical protein
MKAIFCDVCKKTVQNPIKGRNLFHHAHIDVCGTCEDEYNYFSRMYLRKTADEQKPFDFQWFNDFELDVLQKAVQRGRIEPIR